MNSDEAATIRRQAIEECAKVCEEAYADPGWNGHIRNAAEGCANSIRSLAAHPAAPGKDGGK